MKICEIFKSIQGESTYAGLPCAFIRLSGCNLRCSYCDTKYAYEEDGTDKTIDEVINEVKSAGQSLVEITGGEPLLQKEETNKLAKSLLDSGCEVLLETNGSINIKDIDKRVTIILDIKTPGSGMNQEMDFSNFDYLKPSDEIKFVICNRNDYDWAKKVIADYKLNNKHKILFSAAFGMLDPADLANWIIEDRLNVRLNLQLHKYIFGLDERGV